MSRFSDLFQNEQPTEEVFSPAQVAESIDVSTKKVEITEISSPEEVSEEVEVFSQEETYTINRPDRKTRKRK